MSSPDPIINYLIKLVFLLSSKIECPLGERPLFREEGLSLFLREVALWRTLPIILFEK